MIRRQRGSPRGRPGPAAGQSPGQEPFALLGLDPAADLTDDEVRAAWRRIAAATHPDLADGGDPARFAAAAAAFTELRTRYGRGEARAGLDTAAGTGQAPSPADGAGRTARAGQPAGPGRVRLAAGLRGIHGSRAGRAPAVRIAARVLVTAVISIVVVLVSWPRPAAPALITGAVTWLVLSIRRDLTAAGGRHT